MITFNGKNEYIITAKGDTSEYLATMRAILRLVATRDEDYNTREAVYFALNLVDEMLPDEHQLDELKKISL
jgi:hypothetical protein